MPPRRQPLGLETASDTNIFLHNVQGKAKKNAWQKIVDEGYTAEQAQEEYINYVEKLKVSLGYDANKEPEAVGA